MGAIGNVRLVFAISEDWNSQPWNRTRADEVALRCAIPCAIQTQQPDKQLKSVRV